MLIADDTAVLGFPKVEVIYFACEEDPVLLMRFGGIVKIERETLAGEDPLVIFLQENLALSLAYLNNKLMEQNRKEFDI